jgi:nucleoside-diphosphate-sugar epimerase
MNAGRSLVTGGSGYFGHLLVKKLLQKGEEVRVFDLSDSTDRPREVQLCQGDIRNFDAIRRACQGIDTVYHNVAQLPLAKDKELFGSVNRGGTENLLKACAEAGVKKVVHTSSSAVYGIPEKNPVTLEMTPRPGEAYGQTKLEAEKLCQEYATRGLDVSIVRPRTLMGHGRLGLFQILFEWIREGSNVPVLGRGDNVYQFVHGEDFAEGCILTAARKGSETYNFGTDRFETMREVLEDLCRHADTGSRVKSVPMGPAVLGMKVTSALGVSPFGAYHWLMYGRSMYFDISKPSEVLRWKPKYSNTEMFVESYEWYLKNRKQVLATSGSSRHRSAVNQGVLRIVKRLI